MWQVREQVSPTCAGWERVKSPGVRTVGGSSVKTKVWNRARPRGNFANLKTEGAISVNPDEFMVRCAW